MLATRAGVVKADDIVWVALPPVGSSSPAVAYRTSRASDKRTRTSAPSLPAGSRDSMRDGVAVAGSGVVSDADVGWQAWYFLSLGDGTRACSPGLRSDPGPTVISASCFGAITHHASGRLLSKTSEVRQFGRSAVKALEASASCPAGVAAPTSASASAAAAAPRWRCQSAHAISDGVR